ncbi:MAG: hypothetical protein JRF22_03365 [Deltaproteobacteria bacterium]|jgi:ArsR family metal-binding transcriptional regulator|nr:hypothetical protein [Deltaproteobacteria bacterium]MBW2553145.1 hypothetical protein [Deltaproteobacteria bacterium]
MTEENCVNDNDKFKEDLENLNQKIKNALENGGLSSDGLKTLIKETEEAQKRLMQNIENDKEDKNNT